MGALPIVDVAPLFANDDASRARAASDIAVACRDVGFFYAIGHGIADELVARLDAASRRFFALDDEAKRRVAMARAGKAWRGWFPLGGELTSGRPDRKEGIYFGAEHDANDPRVRARAPLFGANLFPAEVPELRPAVLDFMTAATRAAHAILEGVALALRLDASWFRENYTRDPTVLFRVFRYPPSLATDEWGVGEHTDYGLLTLLVQDDAGGLEVRTPSGWIDAPPIAGTIVCNLGDMLERLTAGWFRSTPHRVRNTSGRERLSFPFFFDPSMDARIVPLPSHAALGVRDDASTRWDKTSVRELRGTYGEYLLAKVSKVFPELARESLG